MKMPDVEPAGYGSRHRRVRRRVVDSRGHSKTWPPRATVEASGNGGGGGQRWQRHATVAAVGTGDSGGTR